MNRQNRRHPINPFLPFPQSSKKRFLEEKTSKVCTSAKGYLFFGYIYSICLLILINFGL